MYTMYFLKETVASKSTEMQHKCECERKTNRETEKRHLHYTIAKYCLQKYANFLNLFNFEVFICVCIKPYNGWISIKCLNKWHVNKIGQLEMGKWK